MEINLCKLNHINCDPQAYGNKATGLSKLLDNGINVPESWIISSDILSVIIQEAGFKLYEAGFNIEDADKIYDFIDNKLPKDFYRNLWNSVNSFLLNNGESAKYAVRSSHNLEDNESTSFAGLFSTELNLSLTGDITNFIIKCWRDCFTTGIMTYLQIYNYKFIKPCSIIIQRLISSKVGGVFFKSKDKIIINANWGLAKSVVDGDSEVDQWIVDINTNNVEVILGNKKYASVPIYKKTNPGIKESFYCVNLPGRPSLEVDYFDNNNSIANVCLSEELSHNLCLSTTELWNVIQESIIAANVMKLDEFDIEWCISQSNEIVILQIRPLTRHVLVNEVNNLKDDSQGIGLVGGVVVGETSIVRNDREAISFKNNNLLVTKRLSGATLYSAKKAKGCIIETSSPLSHSAIIARELGLPTVGGIILDKIKENCFYRLNGDLGLIENIENEDGVDQVIYMKEINETPINIRFDIRPKEITNNFFRHIIEDIEEIDYKQDNHKDFDNEQYLLHEFFEAMVKENPNNIAIVYDGNKITYNDLNNKANIIASYLRSVGVTQETLVGICIEPSVEMVVGILAILKSGGAYVPMDPMYPTERLNSILNDTKVNFVLVSKKTINSFDYNCKINAVRVDLLLINPNCVKDLPPIAQANNLAYVIYTSGTTGKPKGVQITHKSVVNFIKSMIQELNANRGDVFLSITTICFDISILEIFLPLSIGARCLVVNRRMACDGKALIKSIEENKISIMQATPVTWKLLLESDWAGNKKMKILCGGESLSKELAKQLIDKSSELWNMYGPTETTIWSSIGRIRNYDEIDIGKPILNTTMYVLNIDGQPISIGEKGELFIGGQGLSRGYFNDKELTDKKFVYNSFLNGERLYSTGDLARILPNGKIELLGRLDYQVKIKGYRIELLEIEKNILEMNYINDAVVIVKDDKSGEKIIVAYIIRKSCEITPMSIRHYLLKKLPAYMIPVKFIFLDKFLYTNSNKVDRNKLRQIESSNDELFLSENKNDTEENNYINRMVNSVCSEILGEKITKGNDNLFNLGIDSIKTLKIANKLKDVGIEINTSDIFKYETIGELCKKIKSNKIGCRENDTKSKLADSFYIDDNKKLKLDQYIKKVIGKSVEIEDVYQLTATQKFMMFNTLFHRGKNYYAQQIRFEIIGEVDINKFKIALESLVKIHDRLRTIYSFNHINIPVQIVLSEAGYNFKYVDLLELSDETKVCTQEELLQLSIKLFDAVPFNINLIKIQEKKYLFVCNYHHVVMDGYSANLVVKDLFKLYFANLEGRNIQLKKYNKFSRYVEWLNGDHEKAKAFWSNYMMNYNGQPKLKLTDKITDEGITNNTIDSFSYIFGGETLRFLEDISKHNTTTINNIIQVVWGLVLQKTLGVKDSVFGLIVSGRMATSSEYYNTPGMFINTVPIRVENNTQLSLIELITNFKVNMEKVINYGFVHVEQMKILKSIRSNFIDHILIFDDFYVSNIIKDNELVENKNIILKNYVENEIIDYSLFIRIVRGNELKFKVSYDKGVHDKESILKTLEVFNEIIKKVYLNQYSNISELI